VTTTPNNPSARSIKHGPWLWTSKAAQERALAAAGPTGLAILTGLCRLESDAPADAKHGFFASATNIAHESGIGVRSVQRHLRALADAGLFSMQPGRKSQATGAYEANKFCLLNVGPALRQVGGRRAATESRVNGGHKRNSPSESKKKDRFAGSEAEASPASGNEKSPATANPLGWPSKSTQHPEQKTTNQPAA
jgi:hypothetical protein